MNAFESSNKVYSFEIDKDEDWKEEVCKGEVPLGLSSHRAVVYGDEMIVFGG